MIDLKNKKILMFSPKFFNYETLICNEIEAQGGVVHYYDERNNPTSFQKILLRKFHFFMLRKINKYYYAVAEKEKEFSPDYVLFISPETVTKKAIEKLRKSFPESKFILYMWDSIENKNAKNVYYLFDSCLSFDQLDCKKYDFEFRPLFFAKDFEGKTDKKIYKYQFSFIGSIHSDRAYILNQLYKYCEKKAIPFYFYLYIPGKLMLFFRKLLDKNVRDLSSFIHINSIDKRQVSEILSDTNYIIDINHPKQIGLTMRTIEMLGLRRKILTTNEYIKTYDFYNSKNQIVINRKNIEVNLSDISDGYEHVDENIYNKYTLKSWLMDILN